MQDSAVYRFSRECILTKCTGDDAMYQDEAKFILPEINKLSAEVKSGSITIFFVSCGMLFPYLTSTLTYTTSLQIFMFCCYLIAELFKEHLDAPLFPGELEYTG